MAIKVLCKDRALYCEPILASAVLTLDIDALTKSNAADAGEVKLIFHNEEQNDQKKPRR